MLRGRNRNSPNLTLELLVCFPYSPDIMKYIDVDSSWCYLDYLVREDTPDGSGIVSADCGAEEMILWPRLGMTISEKQW